MLALLTSLCPLLQLAEARGKTTGLVVTFQVSSEKVIYSNHLFLSLKMLESAGVMVINAVFNQILEIIH